MTPPHVETSELDRVTVLATEQELADYVLEMRGPLTRWVPPGSCC